MTLIEPAASVSRKRRFSYALVLTPLLIGNALMLALCLLGFYMLSATRAYVGGESQWSKARAQAVKHLRAYAASGAPAQLQRFQQALQVPLGDRAARLELDKPAPDLRLATAAFERGGNAAADIPGMIRLYRWAGRSDLMRPSVQAWERGDAHIFRLQTMGEQLQQLHAQPGPPGEERLARIAVLMFAIDELDNKLLGLELQFRHDIQLALEAPPASLSVLADEQRLGQVLANLLSNACKYNRHGGRVRVRTELQGDEVRIAIEDQGQGLDEAEQAQLFQPFKRLPATAHLSGTGLGLSIVKLLMEQMGGTVSVSSQPGAGSVFTLTLQAAAQHPG